jgi:peptidoglycan-associated lipoprotein
MAMYQRSGIRILGSVGLLLGCLALAGCPKEPGMDEASKSIPSPTAVAPTAAGPGPTSTAPAPPSREPGEVPVARRPLLEETVVQPPPGRAVSAQAGPEASPLKDVFFTYDTAVVQEDQQAALSDDARWLKANSGVKVRIEGHCDERGTAEYNLGLGERRAAAVRNYLIAAGIPAARLSTVSYGKERPFVVGHDETAWRQNRRAHLAIER